jgi:hypothetical protein
VTKAICEGFLYVNSALEEDDGLGDNGLSGHGKLLTIYTIDRMYIYIYICIYIHELTWIQCIFGFISIHMHACMHIFRGYNLK